MEKRREDAVRLDTSFGAWESYSDGLQSALASASTPGGAASAMDAVLASASGLGASDSEILDGFASIGESDAYYWYDQEMMSTPG